MNKSADNFFINGCGRCPLGGTPECKVHDFTAELKLLRAIVLESGLPETCKWGVPCYTYQNKNLLMISAFKAHCTISFLNGALLKDEKNILEKLGQHTQAARVIKFDNVEKVQNLSTDIKSYIYEAIELEKAGIKVVLKKNPEPLPLELENRFEQDPVFKAAFESLTPGRQRGYILFFSGAKQAKTREARIEKSVENILNGIGMHDEYKSRK